MSHRYHITPDVLIPRKSSECLVTTAVDWCKTQGDISTPCIVLDLGTGSGCLLLSILGQLRSQIGRTAFGVGADISKEALMVARRNSTYHGLDEYTLCIDHSFYGLESVECSLREQCGSEEVWKNFQGFDIIVCNPPYSSIKEVINVVCYSTIWM
jgi:release factor glutamine methyltransferase